MLRGNERSIFRLELCKNEGVKGQEYDLQCVANHKTYQ